MFTEEQIEEANSKVKSGADFAKLAQNLIGLRITKNDVYVNDGDAEHFGQNGHSVETKANYSPLELRKRAMPNNFLTV